MDQNSIVTIAEIQKAENKTFNSAKKINLAIENAGLIIAQEASINANYNEELNVLVLVGPGNNGSDALVAARLLAEWGSIVSIFLLKERNDLSKFLKKIKKKINFIEVISKISSEKQKKIMQQSHCIIDGLYGIGWDLDRKSSKLNKIGEQLIKRVNNNKKFTLSIDIPSGINANTGQASKNTIFADITITFGALKIGMTQEPALSHAGNIIVENLGIDKNIKKFAFQYSKYFSKYKKFVKGAIISDLIPRIIILPGSGAFSLGRSFKESQISLDIFLSVIKSIGWAKRIGNFKSIPKKEIFKMEYWPLERAKISNKKEANLS